MKAIIPINITALRVSTTDATNIVTNFKGRIAGFDNLPYEKEVKKSSTGDAILQPLGSKNSPLATLREGIHLHWELPDYFKKGIQSVENGKIIFPQVPNRWLVTRYLCKYDTTKNKWLQPVAHSWIVESDYISASQLKDKDNFIRASVPVPLPVNIGSGEQPYRYMGRVIDSAEWPLVQQNDKYLKDFNDADGNPYYLNALGFLGPAFSSYYPDCCSVFGFHDRFLDDTEIYDAIRLAKPVQFKVSYHIAGWIEGADPCDYLKEKISHSYEQYIENCRQRREDIKKTPLDFFFEYTQENFGWQFQASSLSYELDEHHHLKNFEIPEKTLCNGIIQEIVWNMLSNPGAKNFLGNPAGNIGTSIWEDNNIRLSMGNTSVEALAALLCTDISTHQKDSILENNYEYLLNMLQSGRIEEIDNGSNLLSRLEKGLHSDGFASEQGGLKWVIQKKKQSEDIQGPAKEPHLPFPIHRSLELLNEAQKNYDIFRENLEVERKQFFMDWYRYIKMYAENNQNYHVTLTDVSSFVESSFDHIIGRGEEAGILSYAGNEDNGVINFIRKPEGSNSSKAHAVWTCFEECRKEIEVYPEWELLAIPATAYRLPTDPVTAIEVDNLHCKMRNGDIDCLPVRVTADILDRLEFTYGKFKGLIETKDIFVLPVAEEKFPDNPDIQKLSAEAWLIIPSLAGKIILALKRKGGTDNPAVENEEAFLMNFTVLLGGGSSVDAPEFNTGLFNTIRKEEYQPVPNQNQKTHTSPELSVTFTNSKNQGWLTHPLGWSTQEHFAGLNEKRHDPFLPLSIIWEVKMEPIKRDKGNQNYSEENITRYFSFNTEASDYTYTTDKPFTDVDSMKYTGSIILMKKAIQSLTSQIEKYSATPDNNPDNEDTRLKVKRLKERKIISLTLSGFSTNTLLRDHIPPMPLLNLTQEMDVLSNQYIREGLSEAEYQKDNWYINRFNNEAPISVGPSAQIGFCPLRSGFLAVESLEMVDVFGQRMQLFTPKRNPDSSLQLLPSTFLSPIPGDKQHKGKAYLPPRLLTPSRLLFKWLDAHPLTVPACGWVLPNHLDHSLFFYNSDGSAIGSFGIEHDTLKYRTRAGNRVNPSDSLETDIGTTRQPKVNPWLAHFMRYIDRKSGGTKYFLTDLMQAILDSENFISPEKNPDNGLLAVLIGRPLAITRIALGMETYGASFPLNQSVMCATDPWPEDVKNERFKYVDRMKYGDAGLSHIRIPVRLGDQYNMDDGLIGYVRETGDDDNPYGTGDFYTPAAGTGHGVVHPSDTNLQLYLNAKQQTFTMLIDPRAKVHALTGVLPAESLEFPPDYFTEVVGKLQMTFFTHPLLQQKFRFTLQLPEQKGYTWSWVTRHLDEEIPLPAPCSQEDISWGYSPQTLEEGWLKLSPDNDKSIQ